MQCEELQNNSPLYILIIKNYIIIQELKLKAANIKKIKF